MSTIYAPMIGRFGNLLFQMAYARKFCELNGHTLMTDPWIGERVFENWPKTPRKYQVKPDVVWPEHYRQRQCDLIYSRREVRDWFKLKPEWLDKLSRLDRDGNTELVLSVRDGDDHRNAGLACLSDDCYRRAVHRFGCDINGARWLRYTKPETCEGFDSDRDSFGCNVSTQPLPSLYRMLKAKAFFRAPSTFDWWGAVLSDAKTYAPVVFGLEGGKPGVDCENWVEGNWPWMNGAQEGSDLYLRDGEDVQEMFNKCCSTPSDINEHLKTLAEYAMKCGHATEFGTRGIVSTWALLEGCRKVVSYDQTHPGCGPIDNAKACALANGGEFQFICADVKTADIEPTDLLFIDTYHTYNQLRVELERHAHKVRKWIILHDTETFGHKGEAESENGLVPAYQDYLRGHPEWRVKEVFHNNNGLTVLERV